MFNDPHAALANLRPGNYDLIIDIGMPKVSGFDLYRELKKKRRQYQGLLHDCI